MLFSPQVLLVPRKPPVVAPTTTPTLIGTPTTATGNSGTTLVINKPTGVASGDLLIAICASTTATWTGDTGWTEVIDVSGGPRIAYLVAGGSEPASYTFTPSVNVSKVGAIIAYRNAAYDVVGADATNTTQTASAITLSANDSTLIAIFLRSASATTWSGATAGLSALTSNNTNYSMQIYSQDLVASGSTGTKSATPSSTTTTLHCVLLGIKPA